MIKHQNKITLLLSEYNSYVYFILLTKASILNLNFFPVNA